MVTLFSSSNTPHQPHNKQEDAPRSDFADNPTATRALDDARAVTHSFPSKSIDSPGNLFTTHHVGQSQVHGERCKRGSGKESINIGRRGKSVARICENERSRARRDDQRERSRNGECARSPRDSRAIASWPRRLLAKLRFGLLALLEEQSSDLFSLFRPP